MNDHDEFPSKINFDPTLFLLSIPLLGLWYYLLLGRKKQEREDVRRIFVLHAILLIYFLSSELFLFLSLWIVPYFVEPVLFILIRINIVISTTLFGVLTAASLGLSWDWFEQKRPLVLIRDWFFSSR